MRKLAIALLLLAACTKKQDQCMSNMDCTDPAYPFCDVSGQYAPSGGDKNVCTIIPPDCPVDVCGCEPGAVTCGSDSMLTTCNADGASVTQSLCQLGCEASGTTCKTIEPSNGLGPALVQAPTESAVTLGSGATIDTDAGTVTDANGTVLAVASTLIPQTDIAAIRVFIAHTFDIGNITVTGSNAVALVSDGPVNINGLVSLVSSLDVNGQSQGPGAQPMSASCTGGSSYDQACVNGTSTTGCGYAGGGGGNYMAGAASGGIMMPNNAGGAVATGFSPLTGGCAGGAPGAQSAHDLPGVTGAGGGAIQIVSAASVTLDGVINVGGGGGTFSSGGGAGGVVIIESPVVTIHDSGGIAANGGGGGGCDSAGADATPDTTPAPVGTCKNMMMDLGTAGAGGTLSSPPGAGVIQTSGVITVNTPNAGGGGGSVGRARIATLDGTVSSTAGAILSVALTNDTLVIQ